MNALIRNIDSVKPVGETERKILDLLEAEDFIIAGRRDLQAYFSTSSHGISDLYLSYQVYVPRIFHEIIRAFPEATLVPATINIYTAIDGNLRVSVINTTEVILLGIQNDTIRNAMEELNRLLAKILSGIAAPVNFIPDIETSLE